MSILSITSFGFNLLIGACFNCPIDFKLSIMIPGAVGYNVESV